MNRDPKNIPLLAGAFFVVILFVFVNTAKAQIEAFTPTSISRSQIVIQTQTGQEYTFNVELAITPQQQRQGLMNKASMENNAGMLFLFPTQIRPSFWMKNTLISLDIIFIAKDGAIHHIHHNAHPQDMELITPIKPIKAVLEIKGGTSAVFGIQKGDKVLHPFFKNHY